MRSPSRCTNSSRPCRRLGLLARHRAPRKRASTLPWPTSSRPRTIRRTNEAGRRSCSVASSGGPSRASGNSTLSWAYCNGRRNEFSVSKGSVNESVSAGGPSFHEADPQGPVGLLHALATVLLKFQERTDRIDVFGHDIRFLMDRLEIEQTFPVQDVDAVPPHRDLVQVRAVSREVPCHLHNLGGRL